MIFSRSMFRGNATGDTSISKAATPPPGPAEALTDRAGEGPKILNPKGPAWLP